MCQVKAFRHADSDAKTRKRAGPDRYRDRGKLPHVNARDID
jgi:hypothetical protein